MDNSCQEVTSSGSNAITLRSREVHVEAFVHSGNEALALHSLSAILSSSINV